MSSSGALQDLLGFTVGPVRRTWSVDDSLLYALAVGAGQDDPLTDLAYTTENTEDVGQQAVPSMAVVLGQISDRRSALTGVDFTRLLHAEQSLTLAQPLAVVGAVDLRSEVTGVYDKSSGALLETTVVATDPTTGAECFRTRSSMFIRGEGGWGGDRGPTGPGPVPDRAPDDARTFQTAPNQALLYRLTGDRNRLHSDPSFARTSGFDRPILHGLATYGIATRVLVDLLCGGDPARLRHIEVRFTRPVYPGDTLTVRTWTEGMAAAVQVVNGAGEVVLDRGRCHWTAG